MKKGGGRKKTLMVSEEAIEDFLSLNTSQRLRWLDEMRTFLSKTLPPQTKKVYEEFRRGWETPEERLKRTMRIPPKIKLEWLEEMRKVEVKSRRWLKGEGRGSS